MRSLTNKIEKNISKAFNVLGKNIATSPRQFISGSILLALVLGSGLIRWSSENRDDKLWVPQNTDAEEEETKYLELYPRFARIENVVIRTKVKNGNVLEKKNLLEVMKIHNEIVSRKANIDGKEYDYLNLCSKGNSCSQNSTTNSGICQCMVKSILRQWDYNISRLEEDTDIFKTLNDYGSKNELKATLGNPIFAQNKVESAEAFKLSYFLEDRSRVKNGQRIDPVNKGWEKDVFLDILERADNSNEMIILDYSSSRSFDDEFGDVLNDDLALVNISYIVVFIFLGAILGSSFIPGRGSRWTVALAAICLIALSTLAGFGLSSAVGWFYTPVHGMLPFILLGIGVDDIFIICNAFDRELKVARSKETDEEIITRSANALARAGSSITVTSLTDIVAFAISSSSSLPALSSFCSWASICILFLWIFACTFFPACLVFDEKRQRDNRRECLCWLQRPNDSQDENSVEEEKGNKISFLSTYFIKYHSSAIFSTPGKALILLFFSGFLACGIYGATQLSVEDTSRYFIPEGSYLLKYLEISDKYFTTSAFDVSIIFTDDGSESKSIYAKRQDLVFLNQTLAGRSNSPPYITEPISDTTYSNVMRDLKKYLDENGSTKIGNATLGKDGWPVTEQTFIETLMNYTRVTGPGGDHFRDVSFSKSSDVPELKAIRVKIEYVKLLKKSGSRIIEDAEKQIKAMDATRRMVTSDSWKNKYPPTFVYSAEYLSIEGYKRIRKELFQNLILAIVSVSVIILFTVASIITAGLITLNVAFCIIEILGFMFYTGIAIDSVSVINVVLAVGLSVDYSAHVGHCFMTKIGSRNERIKETLADIGTAVLSGAFTTFLAVVVLFFAESYVFNILAKQFGLTVGFGILHGLVLLPVMLSLVGPDPYSSTQIDQVIEQPSVSNNSIENKDLNDDGSA